MKLCFSYFKPIIFSFVLLFFLNGFANIDSPKPKPTQKKKPRNVIFILTDDHRYDYMGFTGKVPWSETPNMDRLAKEGAYLPNALETTSLC